MRRSSLASLRQEVTGEVSLREQLRQELKDSETAYVPRRSSTAGLETVNRSATKRATIGASKLAPLGASGSEGSLSPTSPTGRRASSKGSVAAQKRSSLTRSTTLPFPAPAEAPAAPVEPVSPSGPLKPLEKSDSNLVWIARACNVPLDTCRQASYLFLEQIKDLDQCLSRQQFASILLKTMGKKTVDDLPDQMLQHAFKVADTDRNGEISFRELVTWLATVGFSEHVTCGEEERGFRDFCAKHGFSLVQVEKYRKFFNEFDTDNSGEIDYQEFEQLLHKCGKIPKGVEIPTARVKQLWNEADLDKSGAIDFEEFAIFYSRYFDIEGGMGFEGFYRNVRPALGQLA